MSSFTWTFKAYSINKNILQSCINMSTFQSAFTSAFPANKDYSKESTVLCWWAFHCEKSIFVPWKREGICNRRLCSLTAFITRCIHYDSQIRAPTDLFGPVISVDYQTNTSFSGRPVLLSRWWLILQQHSEMESELWNRLISKVFTAKNYRNAALQ